MDGARTVVVGIVSVVVAAAAVGGCGRGSEGAVPSTVSPPATVQATFDTMRDWYEEGAYARLRPHIDPTRRDNVIDMLLALDELMAANAGVLDAVRAACPDADLKPFDLSCLRDWLVLFSRELRVVHEQRQDARAVLTVQVGPRLPLERLHFERRGGTWVYLPGRFPREAAGAVRRLAGTLERYRVTLAARPPATQDRLLQEYRLRVRPRLVQIARCAAMAESTSGTARVEWASLPR